MFPTAMEQDANEWNPTDPDGRIKPSQRERNEDCRLATGNRDNSLPVVRRIDH